MRGGFTGTAGGSLKLSVGSSGGAEGGAAAGPVLALLEARSAAIGTWYGCGVGGRFVLVSESVLAVLFIGSGEAI